MSLRVWQTDRKTIATARLNRQRCDLGLKVSVLRRSQDIPVSSRSHLDKNCQRLGLSHLRFVPEANFRPNCEGHIVTAEIARVRDH